MIKNYHWFEFDKLRLQYKNDQDALDLIDSLEKKQRMVKFYEHYCVSDDILEKNRLAAQDAADTVIDPKVLADHIWNLTDDIEQLRRERDMFKTFYFENKLKK